MAYSPAANTAKNIANTFLLIISPTNSSLSTLYYTIKTTKCKYPMRASHLPMWYFVLSFAFRKTLAEQSALAR